MKKYELLLVLPGTLDEKEADAKTSEVMAIVNEFGVKADMKALGKNRLAYPINQVRYGYFYTVAFEAETENIKKVEEKLRLTRGLLRATVTIYNQALEGAENIPSIAAGNRYDRDENADETPEVKHSAPVVHVEAKEEVKVEEVAAVEPIAEVEATETVIEEVAEVKPEKVVKAKETKKPKTLDLKEIDKKLDEILSDDNINI